jgi:hypothetical protein
MVLFEVRLVSPARCSIGNFGPNFMITAGVVRSISMWYVRCTFVITLLTAVGCRCRFSGD